ncbi:MAG: FAD:protein FMN transferase [Phycisphaerales bacterium]|nr:FAD:protein FMN transferase [Planctomycetota bacterium]MCH8508315.1 FAD:protein FMN transferase [Phycisphaerales bacterium]
MPDQTAMRSFGAMGTRFECVLAAFDRPVHRTEAAAMAEEAEFLVRDWHGRLTVFEPASAVSVINDLAFRRPVSLDPELFDLLARCLDYTRATGGRFDITVGALMHAHGFRSGKPGVPDAAWGADLVRLERAGSTVRFLDPGLRIDLGAIAKGFVLDLIREDFNAMGVASALVHGGTSSVLAIGSRPDGSAWRVRAMPDDPDAPVLHLTNEALSVSAPSGRVVASQPHIMDPAAGCPAVDPADAACVAGPSAEVCEAWSTALVIDPSLTADLPDGYRSLIRKGSAWRSSVAASVCSPGSCPSPR